MKFSRKDVWTVPNILTYIRLLCVPVFFVLMVLYCIAPDGVNSAAYIWSAFGDYRYMRRLYSKAFQHGLRHRQGA